MVVDEERERGRGKIEHQHVLQGNRQRVTIPSIGM